MNRTIPILFSAILAAAPAFATDTSEAGAVAAWQDDPTRHFEASEVDIDEFQWIARPVVVFADTPADPRFQEQLAKLDARPDALVERDVVVILDSDPDARSELRRKLRPRGFMLAIVGKDGGVKLRKPLPWDVREITRSIDKMPMRRQEIRDRAGTASE